LIAARFRQKFLYSLSQGLRIAWVLFPRIRKFLRFRKQVQPGQVYGFIAREQDCSTANKLGILAKFVVIRQRSKAVNSAEASTIKHLHDTTLARVKGYIREALILVWRLIPKQHPRFRVWQTHALQQENSAGQRSQIANRQHGAFQVVKKPKTKYKIKGADAKN